MQATTHIEIWKDGSIHIAIHNLTKEQLEQIKKVVGK